MKLKDAEAEDVNKQDCVIITSAEEIMFSLLFICLSVSVSSCLFKPPLPSL